jgi:calcium-dependent protein kinase
MVTALFN